MSKKHKPVKRYSIGKTLLFSLLPAILLLSVSEISLRIWAQFLRTPYERYNYTTDRFELVPNLRKLNGRGEEFLINSKGFVGLEFETQKPPGVFRIMALGDSCTFNSGYWESGYPSLLEHRLNAILGSRKYEVINAGIEGYNSEQALSRLKEELLRYDPDMVIIYIGWNDLMKIDPSNVSGTGEYTFLAKVMEKSFVLKAYAKVMFYYIRPHLMKPRLGGNQSDMNAFDQFVPLPYKKNLTTMIEVLKAKNIIPLLVTRPTVVTSDMTYGDLEKHNVFFPYYPDAYSIDRLLSLHQSYNKVVREVASDYSVQFVDLENIFNTRSKGVLFWDTMHPSVKGNELIAESLYFKVNCVIVRHCQEPDDLRMSFRLPAS